jgi:hypothetical protein
VERNSKNVAVLGNKAMPLYKYMSGEGALRFFRSGMLRFTQPVEFNDPFEMQPFLRGLADGPMLEKQFHEQFGATLDPEIEAMLAKLTPEQRARVDSNSIRQTVQQQAPEALGILKKLTQIITPLVDRQIYKTVNENLGALCLTEKPDNLLMWAHYADHHRGVVIEFDQNHDFFNRRLGPQDDFRHFRKVDYTQDRPAVFLADSNAVAFFYFKSKEWEYEQEWRLIVPLVDCSTRIHREIGLPICLFSVPPECIRSIIVGCRMPERKKYELTKEARLNPPFQHVTFEQAYPDERVFIMQRRFTPADAIDQWISKVPAGQP